MPRTRPQLGHHYQSELPRWDLLISIVGLELVGWFMWMGEVELQDLTHVHAYKHYATRRYLHLGDDGRVFVYVPRFRYREISLEDALDDAFMDWEDLIPEPSAADVEALAAVRQRLVVASSSPETRR